MNRKGMRIAAFALLIMLCFAMLPVAAFAADGPEVTVPVEIKVSGFPPETDEVYEVLIKADDPSFPMPAGAVGDEAVLTITGEGTGSFTMQYGTVGIYTYTISQTAGTNPQGTYDATEYELTVYVTNSESGDGLAAAAVLSTDGAEAKPAKALFENSYEAVPVDLTVKKVWIDNGKNRPSSVTVALCNGDTKVDTVTLSGDNKWQYTWKKLQGDVEWKIVEKDIPVGYAASYDYKDGEVIVYNTSALIQTGQLYWPILVLLFAGVCFVTIGILRVKRRQGS